MATNRQQAVISTDIGYVVMEQGKRRLTDDKREATRFEWGEAVWMAQDKKLQSVYAVAVPADDPQEGK